MKKLPLLVASHLLLGGVAFFFAKDNYAEHQDETIIRQEALASSKEESSPQTSQSLRGSAKPPSSPSKRGETHTSATFYAAWNALPDQKLSPKDRILAQRKILAEWAKVDLAAAMEMAISEGWDDSAQGLELGDTYRQGPYASALRDAFLANPEQSWAILQSDQLGLGRSMLRHAWLDVMSEEKPLVLASKLGEISCRERDSVISSLSYRRYEDTSREQIFQELANYSEEVIATEQLLRFLPTLSPEDARKALAEVTDFESRSGELSLMRYGKALNDSLRLSKDDFREQFAQVASEIEELPHSAQGELLYGLYTDFGTNSHYGGGAEKTFTLLEQLIAGEHWDLLDQREVVRQFKDGTSELSAAERAAWATELPERKETYELFYRGVEGYIGENMDLAWDWIQEFPADHWRDRALAVFSQEALQKHKDYAASQRALNAMRNPSVRNAAEGWRPQWAKDQDQQ